ncbi:MAG: ATP synthase F1 subunit delta [Solirubrobacterales bacterium]
MEEIARIYGQALFEAAQSSGKVDEIKTEIEVFSDAITDSRDLRLFLFSPYFSGDEKRNGIARVVQDATPEFVNFLQLLAEKHRLPAIHRIRAQYDTLWAQENKILPVTVTSAVALQQETIDKIAKSIEDQTGHRVELDDRVDDAVLGGIILQVGNMVLDASIQGRLERLRKQVMAT